MTSFLAASLLVWRLTGDVVTPDEGAQSVQRVGSLQKAFVLEAYARAHPEADGAPAVKCDATSRCWLPRGHGTLSLREATTRSCNTYFQRLAEETPEGDLREALSRAGFTLRGHVSPEAAIGLPSPAGSIGIAPAALLRAYAALVREPWVVHDDWRRDLLDGMRDAALEGTAAGFGPRGLLVKTGTVPAVDGRPLGTSGWALAIDPAGASAWLAFEPKGNGAGAARELADVVQRDVPSLATRPFDTRAPRRLRPSRAAAPSPVISEVRVRLFASLRDARLVATNAGNAPVRAQGIESSGWIGPGAEVRLAPGARLSSGTWRLRVEPYGLVRVVVGSIETRAGSPPTLVTPVSHYVEGVLRGELGSGRPEKLEELEAAVLRFLGRGARHGGEDVCDLSHCARFVGYGPLVAWPTPSAARILAPADPST
ncbi:MAG TPA: penicillin-binding transpeptidase domain-containing protein, partial [Thermoanaerobaculia bacterium]|nr:penicillin-binding transpeptidase domain-containing protein [Thermoanaerobaculia bacterium]